MGQQVETVVALLMVTIAVAALARLLPIANEVVMAAVGLGAGVALGPAEQSLAHSVILVILLPGLLFEASYRLSWRYLRANLLPVVLLGTVGVLVTAGVVALLGHAALGLGVAAALLLGAMVAPTDPVAVVGLFKKVGVPDRLTNLVEAESLANDGTGVVLFTVALGALTTGQISAGGAVVEFVRLAFFGLALGVAVGLVVSLLTSRVDDFQVEISLTALAAYGSYLLADLLHVSGILAVVATGVVLGSFGRPRTMSARTQDAVELFWDYIAFLLNSLAFLLVGLEVPYRAVLGQWELVMLAALIALLARAVTVYGILGSLSRSRFRVPLNWQHILVWGGVRGVIAVALVLSLGGSGGQIGEVRALVYGVTLISIVVQGLTIGPLARYLLRDRGGGAIPSA